MYAVKVMNISISQAKQLTQTHGSPLYIYSYDELKNRALCLKGLGLPFGLTVRYAVKANPHPDLIRLFNTHSLHFDVSSSYEADMLLGLGIDGAKISLSSQQPAHNLMSLLARNVHFVATSLHQLQLFTNTANRGAKVALRINTGTGSGHNNRTATAGPSASFGIWHEYLGQALAMATSAGIVVDRLHTHVGSGADFGTWRKAIDASLKIAAQMPDVTILDLGGGYKVKRAEGEHEADMSEIASMFSERLEHFYSRTGRKLHLEIEPGTWLVAHAGILLTEIIDIVDTGTKGYTFLRTNTGMNDFLRPTLYGAHHAIRILNDNKEQADYVVVGHNCESGDILTVAAGNAEIIQPRRLPKANIGDLLVIEDVGAYPASLRAIGYNAFPVAKEVLIRTGS